jgi:SAM-dependent methyltransferase
MPSLPRSMDWSDATRRFSTRVEHYHKYRPGYPSFLIDFLRDACGLAPGHVVADIGCGTGLLADLFLTNGNRVYGIEPNPDMRAAAERAFAGCERFLSIGGRGECTTLPDDSVDFVTVGRAFHWLEPAEALREFSRILRLGGWTVIVWLTKRTSSTFLAEYDALLGTYQPNRDEMLDRRRRLQGLLTDRAFASWTFGGSRAVTLEDLEGETLSYSISPQPGHPLFAPMRLALRVLFGRYQQGGHVTLEDDLSVYYKRLDTKASANACR